MEPIDALQRALATARRQLRRRRYAAAAAALKRAEGYAEQLAEERRNESWELAIVIGSLLESDAPQPVDDGAEPAPEEMCG